MNHIMPMILFMVMPMILFIVITKVIDLQQIVTNKLTTE